MDQHTIELLLAGLGGPAAIAGVGQVIGYVLKKRADAKVERERAEGEAEKLRAAGYREAQVIHAQTEQQQQAHADAREDTATHRLFARLDRAEERLERAEERLDRCIDAERECQEERTKDRETIARMGERLERVEGRVESIPPKAKSLVDAIGEKNEKEQTG